ncbi:hypothetical protein EW026_g7537 [Hermanssonia centrifuga]|uniref:Cytochrome c-type biogenesis protein H TPR domain-containing protein n=1 Tax=Hermanssonia centrifuga TaxID=98765 RepID=A0A4S4K997_9APHY|nr:hypothetical protein EW026_g7537 [Hermanssonia centrifuga]
MNGNSIPSTPLTGPPPPPSAAMVTSPAAPIGTNGMPVPQTASEKLASANETTWLLIGRVAEQMGNLEHALSAYEHALRHNPQSLSGLTQVAGIARIKENYPKAVEYFQRVIKMQHDNGEVWSALGHCYLMQDDLQQAYAAYQQALYLLPNPKEDPKLWYGIGILYDRYGSLDHAEEAFASVLRMDKDFDKANEILFRLGIIYKQQGKYKDSLECFDRILRNPPNPLAHADIWFQIGHVYEQQHDYNRAREAYERVVQDNPTHAKVLQQLGWLYHQDGSSFQNQDLAIQYLTKSLEADPTDAQSWYLLGRAYMAGQKYNKAYEAYQQAVYRDGRNPTFWCSIGVLYFQINQYRDALDAYSRAIRINPYISEVWFDLGSLYESCNNQISDAIDAYARAAELDPSNAIIAQRLQLLKNAQATGSALPAAPGPQDVHPTAYANPMIPQPAGITGPPLMMNSASGIRPLFRTDSRGPNNELPLPHPPNQLPGRSSPGPFRGGPPPPLNLDDSRRPPSHTPLAPMDVDGPPALYSRDGPRLLLHQPASQPHPGHPHEPFRLNRMHSSSMSPPPSARQLPPFGERPPTGPAHLPSRSPRVHPRELTRDPSTADRDSVWDRRMPPGEWERESRGRPPADYPPHPQYFQSRPHSPSFSQHRAHSRDRRESPPETSPRNGQPGFSRPGYWDPKQSGGPIGPATRGRSPVSRSSISEVVEPAARRYGPLFDGRESQPREFDREPQEARFVASPETTVRLRNPPPPPPPYAGSVRGSESPHLASVNVSPMETKGRGGRRAVKNQPSQEGDTNGEPAKKPRRRAPKRQKEDTPQRESPYGSVPQPGYARKSGSQGSPEPPSSNGSGSGSAGRSVQPSPTNSVHLPPARVVDEDYDEGVAEALINMAYRGGPAVDPADPRNYGAPGSAGPVRSPPGGRTGPQSGPHAMSPHSMSKHPGMLTRSPPTMGKRRLSPGPEDSGDVKRSRVGSMSRRVTSPTAGNSSRRPSPVPFRQQPTSHSPEIRPGMDAAHSYPPSPALPTQLPPHPRPIGTIGAGLAGHAASGPGMSLPPLNTRSPTNATSPVMETDRMRDSRSESPAAPRMLQQQPPKREIVLHSAGSPTGPMPKGIPSPASSHGSHGSHASHGSRSAMAGP